MARCLASRPTYWIAALVLVTLQIHGIRLSDEVDARGANIQDMETWELAEAIMATQSQIGDQEDAIADLTLHLKNLQEEMAKRSGSPSDGPGMQRGMQTRVKEKESMQTASGDVTITAELVRNKSSCGRTWYYLGRKGSVEDCARSVFAFGGKYFTFGRSWQPSKKCFVQFAELNEAFNDLSNKTDTVCLDSASHASHGFVAQHWFNFYQIPSVPIEDSKAITSGGAHLIEADKKCEARAMYVGNFDTLKRCASSVALAGGRFFNYGRNGACDKLMASNVNCSEGLTEASVDFYELPGVSADEVMVPNSIDLEVKVWSSYSGCCCCWTPRAVHLGLAPRAVLVNQELFKNTKLVIAKRLRQKSTNVFTRKNTICHEEYRLGVHEAEREDVAHVGEVAVEVWEVCCRHKYAEAECIPGMPGGVNQTEPAEPHVLIGTSALTSRDGTWQMSGYRSKDKMFEGIIPKQIAAEAGFSWFEQNKLELDDTTEWVTVQVTVLTVRNNFQDNLNQCTGFRQAMSEVSGNIVSGVGNFLRTIYPRRDQRNRSSISTPAFDQFSHTMYDLVEVEARHFQGSTQMAKDRIPLPTGTRYLDRMSTYSFTGLATHEIDGDIDPFDRSAACSIDVLRDTPREQEDLVNSVNTWSLDGNNCPDKKQACTKKEFMTGLFQNFNNGGNQPVLPAEPFDYRAEFYADGAWKDEAEQYLGFSKWASHRVEASDKQGFSWMIRSNEFGSIPVRAGFARVGADMYFDQAGLPAKIVTPDGVEIDRPDSVSDPTWQYWKFVWRSSMLIKVTLVDRIWATGMGAASALAGASREALPPTHPLRRLLSLFTFGTIRTEGRDFMQTLAPDALLDRATPFANFQTVTEAAMNGVQSLEAQFGFLVGTSQPAQPAMGQTGQPAMESDSFWTLAQTSQSSVGNTRYKQDAQRLFDGIHGLVRRWFDLYSDPEAAAPFDLYGDEEAAAGMTSTSQWCDGNGDLKDEDIEFFLDRMPLWSIYEQRHGESDAAFFGLRVDGKYRCAGLINWLSVMLFHVTGFREHVSQVTADVLDPDFAGFSWAANLAVSPVTQTGGDPPGEAFTRPREALAGALLVASQRAYTSPVLTEDFRFIITEDVHNKDRAWMVLDSFRSDMMFAKLAFEERNRWVSGRLQYHAMDPANVQISGA